MKFEGKVSYGTKDLLCPILPSHIYLFQESQDSEVSESR